jgi:hypothetical protein
MKVFVWETHEGGTVACIASDLPSARRSAAGQLEFAARQARTYHQSSESRKLLTLVQTSLPQTLEVGDPPYVVIVPAREREEHPQVHGVSIGSVVNSQVVVASPGAEQNVSTSGVDAGELSNFIAKLGDAIEEPEFKAEDAQDLKGHIRTIQAQLSRPTPSPLIIRETLQSIRLVVQGAAGSLLASSLLPYLQALLR